MRTLLTRRFRVGDKSLNLLVGFVSTEAVPKQGKLGLFRRWEAQPIEHSSGVHEKENFAPLSVQVLVNQCPVAAADVD
jgi:hypothetical protein